MYVQSGAAAMGRVPFEEQGMKLIALNVGLVAMPIVAQAGPIDRVEFGPTAVDVDFEGFSNDTALTTQYQTLGLVFGGERVNNQFAASYGPLAMGNILLADGSSIEIEIVDPATGLGSTTSAIGADIVFRNTDDIARLNVYDAGMSLLGSVSTPPDTGAGDEVFLGFEADGIAFVEFVFDPSDSVVGLDNLVLRAVPAPGGIGLVAVLAVGGARRRR